MSDPSESAAQDAWSPLTADGAIALPATFDLRSCSEIIEAMSSKTGTVLVKADEVEVMTSPGLQTLLAAAKDGVRDLEFVAPSRAFLDCLSLLGCTLADFASNAEETT